MIHSSICVTAFVKMRIGLGEQLGIALLLVVRVLVLKPVGILLACLFTVGLRFMFTVEEQ